MLKITNTCLSLEHPSYNASLGAYSDKELEKILPRQALKKDQLTHLMLLAASQGKFGLVSIFIKAGADRHAVAENGWTLLMFAAHGDNTGVINDIIGFKAWTAEEKLAYINRTTPKKETALYLACNNKSEKAANILLKQKGCDLHLARDDGTTALYAACWAGSDAIVKVFLTQLADEQVKIAKPNGATCLIAAAAKGHSKVVDLLLAKVPESAWVNRETGKLNALDMAFKGYLASASADYKEVVCSLIMKGAVFGEFFKLENPDYLRLYQFMEIRRAEPAAYGEEVVKAYIDSPSEERFLGNIFLAMNRDDEVSLEKHLKSALNVEGNIISRLFLFACSVGSTKCISLLLKNEKFYPSVRDAYQQSGLHIACLASQPKVVALLLDSVIMGITLEELRKIKEHLIVELSKQEKPDYTAFNMIDSRIPLPGDSHTEVSADTPMQNVQDKALDFPNNRGMIFTEENVNYIIRLIKTPSFLRLSNERKVEFIYNTLQSAIYPYHSPLVASLLEQLLTIPSQFRSHINLSEALVYACQYAENPVIDSLLDKKQDLGIDVNFIMEIPDDKGNISEYTAWHVAHLFANNAAVESLKKQGAQPDVGDKYGALQALYAPAASSRRGSLPASGAPPVALSRRG